MTTREILLDTDPRTFDIAIPERQKPAGVTGLSPRSEKNSVAPGLQECRPLAQFPSAGQSALHRVGKGTGERRP